MSLLDPITVHPKSLQPTEAWDDILNKPGPLQPQVMRYELLLKQCYYSLCVFFGKNEILCTNLYLTFIIKSTFFQI